MTGKQEAPVSRDDIKPMPTPQRGLTMLEAFIGLGMAYRDAGAQMLAGQAARYRHDR
uniref:Uncharacterized protein n=1 Tax=Aquisalinus luteolus TaxID=1566827 RepID=A0A8J3A3D9_9PROT|nr:hypothetical protein GCM10011355_27470 [Aquisalinus luteolus]